MSIKLKLDFCLSGISDLLEKLGFKKARPPLENYYIYFLLFFISFLIADFMTTSVRNKMMPKGVGGKKAHRTPKHSLPKRVSVFPGISEKNIFNEDHFIPKPFGIGRENFQETDDLPVPTSLPLKLLGTIIHSVEDQSVATVQVSGKNIRAIMKGEEVDNMFKTHTISRHKVVFRNLQNQKLEYMEIKEKDKLKIGVLKNKPSSPTSSVVSSEPTEFRFKRDEINKHLENLPKVLQDAKAVPYITPGSGGEVGGFKIIAIKAGSVYEKLGLKRDDIIKGVNGEMVNSAQKAMELYQILKNSDEIQLEIGRNGEPKTLNYTVE